MESVCLHISISSCPWLEVVNIVYIKRHKLGCNGHGVYSDVSDIIWQLCFVTDALFMWITCISNISYSDSHCSVPEKCMQQIQGIYKDGIWVQCYNSLVLGPPM